MPNPPPDAVFMLCCLKHTKGKPDFKAVADAVGYASNQCAYNRLSKLKKDAQHDVHKASDADKGFMIACLKSGTSKPNFGEVAKEMGYSSGSVASRRLRKIESASKTSTLVEGNENKAPAGVAKRGRPRGRPAKRPREYDVEDADPANNHEHKKERKKLGRPKKEAKETKLKKEEGTEEKGESKKQDQDEEDDNDSFY